MTTFKAAVALCGLSQQDAADFLGVRLDTVKSWSAGRNNPPLEIWKLLAKLFEQIMMAAENAADVMELEGIDPRAYNDIEADGTIDDPLPVARAMKAAGAAALLMAIADKYSLELTAINLGGPMDTDNSEHRNARRLLDDAILHLKAFDGTSRALDTANEYDMALKEHGLLQQTGSLERTLGPNGRRVLQVADDAEKLDEVIASAVSGRKLIGAVRHDINVLIEMLVAKR